jgi:hypothetical protein
VVFWLLELFAAAAVRGAATLPRVLTAEQEEQVWAAVIRQDGPRLQQALLRVDATARRARESWKLLREWQLDLADRRFAHNENPEAFRRWASRFRLLSEGRGEAAEADIGNLLLPLLATGACALPPRLLLAGFYDLTPAQQTFVEALRGAGCAVDWAELRSQPGQARRLRADDAHGTMRRRRLGRQDPAGTAQARIGIVAPDLAARRSALAQVLGQFLDPAALAPGTSPAPRPWNLSLGRPLSGQPVVATALRLLALIRQPIATETLGVLLLSPHWALPRAAADSPAQRQQELGRRALLDRRIRALGDTRVRLSSLYYEAGGSRARGNGAGGSDVAGGGEQRTARPWHSELLAARCGALLEASRELPARAPTSAWAAVFTAWLKAAGWGAPQGGGKGCGGRPLDSLVPGGGGLEHPVVTVSAWPTSPVHWARPSAGAARAPGRRNLFQPRADGAVAECCGLYGDRAVVRLPLGHGPATRPGAGRAPDPSSRWACSGNADFHNWPDLEQPRHPASPTSCAAAGRSYSATRPGRATRRWAAVR